MRKRILSICLLLVFGVCTVFTGCSTKGAGNSNEGQKQGEKKDKKGILVVSFGTSYLDALKSCIESSENKIKDSYKDYEVRRSFTSGIIIKKLKERDKMEIDTPEAALDKMKKEGFTEVIVQPLHIMPGEEYDEVKAVVDKYIANKSFEKIVLGRPTLYRTEDYKKAIEALKGQIPKLNKDQAVVFMGHGTPHFADASYSKLQMMIQDERMENVFVGTVEGYPSLDNIIPKLKSKGIKEVTLMPFMLVAGDHANNDMAGEEKDSWKSILKGEGFTVNTYLKGLGENKGFQDIYVEHVKDCIDGNPLKEEKK